MTGTVYLQTTDATPRLRKPPHTARLKATKLMRKRGPDIMQRNR